MVKLAENKDSLLQSDVEECAIPHRPGTGIAVTEGC